MPIVITLDVMMARRKVSSIELSDRLGITPAKLSMLKTNKSKTIPISLLGDICKILDCQPGDILEYMNEKDYKKLMGL